MQALNFLYEVPTENWLDFAVRPRSLVERLTDDGGKIKEPTIEALFCEFVDHAVTEQSLIQKESMSAEIDDEENLSHKMKAATLWNLAFFVAGHLKWNLKLIVDALGLMRSADFMRGLMDAHYSSTIGQAWQNNLELVDLTDLFTASAPSQFAFIMYCRWHVYCSVKESLPRVPTKQTVSNPSSMQDAALIAAEKRSSFLAELCQKTGSVATILEKLCVLSLPTFSIMTTRCFELPAEGKLEYCCDWSAMEVTNGGNLVSQLKFDLGSYYFFMQQYGKAKESFTHFSNVKNFEDFQSTGHFSLTPAAVKGFCAAFKIVSDFSVIPNKMDYLAKMENGDSEEFNQVISNPSTRRLKFSLRQRLNSASMENIDLILRFESQYVIHRIIDGFGLRHGQLNALRQEQFLIVFLREVVAWWDTMRMAEQLCMRTTLSYLCTRIPGFESHFRHEFSKKLDEAELAAVHQFCTTAPPQPQSPIVAAPGRTLNRQSFSCEEGEVPMDVAPAAAPAVSSRLTDCYNPELNTNHGKRWALLVSYEPEEIRTLIPQVPLPWISTLWQTPTHLDPIISRLVHGPLIDMEFAVCCKAQQLGYVGALKDAGSLLQFCEDELVRFVAQSGSNFINPAIETMRLGLRREDLRFALLWWHVSMKPPPDGANESQKTPAAGATVASANKYSVDYASFTDQTLERVKALFAELETATKAATAAAKQKIQITTPPAPSPEVINLCCAFLLNTGDYKYTMMKCTSVTTVVDFSILLAALCYEVQCDTANKNRLAEEFFELLIPTMLDSAVHAKRNADGQLKTRQLLSRAHLGGIIKYLKEALCVSLMLSFLCKIFNCLDNALTTGRTIWTKYSELWPQSYTEATGVNTAFLKDMISQLLENARVNNPANSSWLRSEADFCFASSQYSKAMRGYLQVMFVLSEAFSKPLNAVLERAELGEPVVRNMIQCASRLKCHTQEALLWQLIAKPDYVAASKALEERLVYDAGTDYFQFIWDINMMEFVIYVFEKRNEQLKVQEALRILEQSEMNSHNREDVILKVRERKRRQFLMTLMTHYA